MCGPECVCLLCCVWLATAADLHVEQDGYIKHVCLLLNVWGTVCLFVCCVWLATAADLHVEQDGYIKHVCLLLNVWDTVCLSVVLRMDGNSSRPPCGTGWLHQACFCLLVKCVGHSVSVCCVVYGWQLQQTSMWNRMATSSMFVCC